MNFSAMFHGCVQVLCTIAKQLAQSEGIVRIVSDMFDGCVQASGPFKRIC